MVDKGNHEAWGGGGGLCFTGCKILVIWPAYMSQPKSSVNNIDTGRDIYCSCAGREN